MFNSGIRGKRASDNTGTIASQSQFIQQKYPQPSITSWSIQGSDDTALNPAGGQTVLVNGTGFASGLAVTVNGVTISPVTVVSPTQISFTSTALAGGSYTLIVYNSNGGAAILVPGLIYSAVPTWTTAAGSIGSFYETTNINTSVVATSDSAITYSLVSGSLPSGATLYGNGVITGTSPVESGSSTYTFAIKAEDQELQDTTRTFTLTINTDVVTWSSPANNTTYTSNINQVISNVVLSANSAAGYGITYTANTLPTGLSLTGNTISGTPTVVANSSTLLTATAATTNRNATRTINWVIQLGSDPYFNLTTLLLNGETSSNYWIQDASTNNFAITVNGDTRPTAFSPYETVWSNFFDGTGDYLSAPNNTALNLTSGDFTIELWAYSTTLSGSLIDKDGEAFVSYPQYSIGYSSPYIAANVGTGTGTSYIQSIVGTTTLVVNRWYHVAFVKSGNTLNLYLNGKLDASATQTGSMITGNKACVIGNRISADSTHTGYISNLRVVKGTAVYTSNFTPSTSPLTAIANTSLLTCQSNRLIDNSTNNFVITRLGDTAVRNFGPFVETDITTGSGYFDGTGDFLSVPDNDAFHFGNGSFTIETWFNLDALPSASGAYTFASQWKSGGAGNSLSWFFYLFNSAGTYQLYLSYSTTGTNQINLSANLSAAPIIGTWNHVALVRSGNSLLFFLNGIQVGTTQTITDTLFNSTDFVYIGAQSGGTMDYFVRGYLSNFRIVKGTAVYTTNFTPPTSPLTAIANTSLLTLQNRIGENNNRFVDTSGINNIITRNGNATQGTFSPFSQTGWSNYFDGTGDYLSTSSNSAFNFSTGNFTVEAWIYRTGPSGSSDGIFSNGPTANGSFGFYVYLGALRCDFYGGTAIPGTTTVPSNTWNHVAITRSGTTARLFLNGVIDATVGANDNNTSSDCAIGRSWSNYDTDSFEGYISNLRVLKGTALYTSNFTPSTTPLTAITNTSLLTCQSNRFIDNSANNFTITRNGDVSVQSFSPFAPSIITPTSYSGYFDGSGDYLTVSSNDAFRTDQGDWTIELWVYVNSTASSATFITRGVFLSVYGYFFGTSGTTGGALLWESGNGSWGTTATYTSTSNAVVVGSWNHVAAVRSGTTFNMYSNGVRVFTQASASFGVNVSAPVWIGSFFNQSGNMNGHISNLRFVKGTALYTGTTYTVPTSPLTAITNTSLLTCQSNTFVDNSTNNFTITVNGNAIPRTFNPFGTTSLTDSNASYSITNISGSMYFDGTGDYLSVPSSTALNLSTGSFTIEAFMYVSATSYLFGRRSIATARGMLLYYDSSTFKFIFLAGDTNNSAWEVNITSTNNFSMNQWIHVAITRDNSNVFTLWVNGNSEATTTSSVTIADDASNFLIGGVDNTGAYTGYISNFRIVTGRAVYTSNFVPPVAPVIPIAGTTLLVNGTNGGIIDYTSKNNLETLGNAQLSAIVKKYGSYSMYFDGNGDRLLAATSPNLDLSSGDFTIEGWFYSNTIAAGAASACARAASGNILSGSEIQWNIFRNGSSLIVRPYQGTTDYSINLGTIAANTWYHVALTRSGNTFRGFLNGVQAGTTFTISGSLNNNTVWFGVIVGFLTVGGVDEVWNGYIDDLRITKGVARYTSNFTPPTSAFITF